MLRLSLRNMLPAKSCRARTSFTVALSFLKNHNIFMRYSPSLEVARSSEHLSLVKRAAGFILANKRSYSFYSGPDPGIVLDALERIEASLRRARPYDVIVPRRKPGKLVYLSSINDEDWRESVYSPQNSRLRPALCVARKFNSEVMCLNSAGMTPVGHIYGRKEEWHGRNSAAKMSTTACT